MRAPSSHPLYNIWRGIFSRCNNPSNIAWKNYGARGISICDRWLSFECFVSDMGERPPKHSIERIDNDGNYEPSNCKWATKREQQRNQRVTRIAVIEGRSYKAVELADLCGLKIDTIIERAAKGLSLSEVLDPRRRIFASGLALGGMASGAKKQAKTHCAKGHEFTEKNTKITKQGWRACRRCHADRENERRKLREPSRSTSHP